MAREILSRRLFVSPEAVPGLLRQLEQLCPSAMSALMSRVDADTSSGLRVYATRADRLGPDFRWQSLPPGPGNDSMYSKRPHRFAFAPRHALACILRPQHAATLLGMLRAWMRHAASGMDPLCYDSNLGVIQRILALTWCWMFLAARPEEDTAEGLGLEWRVLQIIEADIRFLEPLLGQSAPNNHLLADWFAAWYLNAVMPELLETPDAGAEQRWCNELLAQTYPDGGSFEHSSHYHEFACEMSAAYLLLSERNGHAPSRAVVERTNALLRYQCAMTGPEATPIAIGNAVEDTLFPLDAGEGWCSGSLREIQRALFEPDLTPAPADDETVVRAFWLLGGRLESSHPETTEHLLPTEFPQAGLYVMRDHALDARMLFRTGPAPGTSVAAGHMHSDLMAVYLNVAGRPVIVDAGTYSYRGRDAVWGGDPNWRHYFVGPWPHNGFACAGRDPLGALQEDFRRRDTDVRVVASRVAAGPVSCIDTHAVGAHGFDGLRRTCIHVSGELWLILDTLPSYRATDAGCWYGLQFAPEIDVDCDGAATAVVKRDGATIVSLTHCPRLHSPDLLYSSRDPLGGFVSLRYGELTPAPQLRYHMANDAGACAMLLRVGASDTRARIVEALGQPDGGQCIRIEMGSVEDWFIFQPGEPVVWQTSSGPLAFDGRLLWLRCEQGRLMLLRWLLGRSVTFNALGVRLRLAGPEIDNVYVDDATTHHESVQNFADWLWPDSATHSS
ncbi:MAG: heparinase II/III family protein [Chromatiaceae bacterium]|nr:heparinase II/III family protein [Chromatiaceae bacterium]MCP5422329.1 heparinase II/III family protein [Chromatiaceae bacterium]